MYSKSIYWSFIVSIKIEWLNNYVQWLIKSILNQINAHRYYVPIPFLCFWELPNFAFWLHFLVQWGRDIFIGWSYPLSHRQCCPRMDLWLILVLFPEGGSQASFIVSLLRRQENMQTWNLLQPCFKPGGLDPQKKGEVVQDEEILKSCCVHLHSFWYSAALHETNIIYWSLFSISILWGLCLCFFDTRRILTNAYCDSTEYLEINEDQHSPMGRNL